MRACVCSPQFKHKGVGGGGTSLALPMLYINWPIHYEVLSNVCKEFKSETENVHIECDCTNQ